MCPVFAAYIMRVSPPQFNKISSAPLGCCNTSVASDSSVAMEGKFGTEITKVETKEREDPCFKLSLSSEDRFSCDSEDTESGFSFSVSSEEQSNPDNENRESLVIEYQSSEERLSSSPFGISLLPNLLRNATRLNLSPLLLRIAAKSSDSDVQSPVDSESDRSMDSPLQQIGTALKKKATLFSRKNSSSSSTSTSSLKTASSITDEDVESRNRDQNGKKNRIHKHIVHRCLRAITTTYSKTAASKAETSEAPALSHCQENGQRRLSFSLAGKMRLHVSMARRSNPKPNPRIKGKSKAKNSYNTPMTPRLPDYNSEKMQKAVQRAIAHCKQSYSGSAQAEQTV